MLSGEFISLSATIQVSLASGYIAYLIAYAGFRKDHTGADATFRSLAFGSIATFVLLWQPLGFVPHALIAFVLTTVAGAVWRRYATHWVHDALRKTNVSWTDDVPNAWLSITAKRTDLPLSQIAADTTDGRLLICDDTRPFKDAPFGPCILGLDGSLAFYVTGEQRSNGSWAEPNETYTENDGHCITYLPAASIKRVELRYYTPPNERVVEEPD